MGTRESQEHTGNSARSGTRDLDKRTLKYLERLFAAEVDGALRGAAIPGLQLPKAAAAKMEAAGLVERVQWSRPDRLGRLIVETHVLTHAGRMAYCATCRDEPEDRG